MGESMGVKRYEPRVSTQLLEFTHRLVTEVLTDAQQYSKHAEKTELDKDDVRLAVRSMASFGGTQPPPKDLLLDLASKRNSKPLPLVSHEALGVHLPEEQEQLTRRNYQVLTKSQVQQRHSAAQMSVSAAQAQVKKVQPKDPTKHNRMA